MNNGYAVSIICHKLLGAYETNSAPSLSCFSAFQPQFNEETSKFAYVEVKAGKEEVLHYAEHIAPHVFLRDVPKEFVAWLREITFPRIERVP